MTDKTEISGNIADPEARRAAFAPETHNDEQDEHQEQAQQVAQDAAGETPATGSPLDSEKGPNESGLMGDSTQDTIDHMRHMESSGVIDMGAYNGEPAHDDEEGKYGKKVVPADEMEGIEPAGD